MCVYTHIYIVSLLQKSFSIPCVVKCRTPNEFRHSSV